jgi:hypothetical protein
VSGVISPLLANLFLHYAFDAWMARHNPHIPFERYADDSVPRRRTGVRSTPCSFAAQEMRVGPSEPLCRRRLQTTTSCVGKEPGW